MRLVIVESPAKAKTIQKYLKELGDDFVVKASVGHVRDLPKSNKNAIDIESGFKPNYKIIKEKEKLINELKELAEKADEVYLATDPDREGEAIAWHLKELLNLKNPKRVEYNEITKEAIKKAFENPRQIDLKRKSAQEARRVLDRLFGYELSGLLWKKLRYGLSAGRVQSPALRILLEREREIRAFKPEKYFEISSDAQKDKDEFKIHAHKIFKEDEKELVDSIKKALNNDKWVVNDVEQRQQKRNPKPPLITSTLQQEASNRFGFSPSYTMRLAQSLYEKGYITYMRTDSTNLSNQAISQISSYIKNNFGDNYLEVKQYKTKSKQAQEAHEAIRPTDVRKTELGESEHEKKLYKLIWQRSVASQMKPALFLKTKAKIIDKDNDKIPYFVANGSELVFDGWFLVDSYSKSEQVILPTLKKGDEITIKKVYVEQKHTQPPNRYTEAGLVKELEKRGIGRPSTYATIIKTLKDREYVKKEGKTLIPTDIGDVVSSFLEKNFYEYIADNFTSRMEEDLDEIAEGKKDYVSVLKDFWEKFKKDVEAKENIEKLTNLGPAPNEFRCPLCNSSMIWKLSKTGKFLSCVNFPKCQGARKPDGSLLEAPKLLDEKCPKCGASLVEKEGRYGKFIACSNYPKCKYIKQTEQNEKESKTGVTCPECKNGEIVKKRGRFGEFYACSNYPKCKFTMKSKPTGRKCDMCGSLMMEGTKTIPERCSNKSCPNHRPDKLKNK